MSYKSGTWNEVVASIIPGTGPTYPTVSAVLASGNLFAYTFAKTDLLYGQIQLPHNYKEGTDIAIHVHWMPSNANTGNVAWNFEYSVANIGSNVGATTILTNTSAAPGTAWQSVETSFSTVISGTGRKIRDVILFRILRNNAGDTFSGNCAMTSVDAYYQADSIGSNSQATKN